MRRKRQGHPRLPEHRQLRRTQRYKSLMNIFTTGYCDSVNYYLRKKCQQMQVFTWRARRKCSCRRLDLLAYYKRYLQFHPWP
jgi:hypothetical protein